ncbi:MAG: secondary thiamine-phosphate synthase enzyme YjbQ [Gammaproteobacteria bacterium]|nr:secondary thiamine-phosphate synthase enzyme YjbQ [Gammaproteobacteria bacterium]
MNLTLTVSASGQGLLEITREVAETVRGSGVQDGLATLFIRHTSASLLIQENADPAVLNDLEGWLNRMVPEEERLYTHTAEGPDDMPAHIKSALTATSLSIPLVGGELALGTWQGIFLWEHRHHRDNREVLINVTGT